jgi:hypothetical protein
MEENSPKNAFISEPKNIADGVSVRMLLENGVQRIQMVLVIDEYTNFDSINRNRKEIKFILNKINSKQGMDLNVKYKQILYALIQWREEGISWGKLTMILNYLGFALIYDAYNESLNKGEPVMILDETQDLISNPSFIASFGGTGICPIFLSLGMTFFEFNSWIKKGYEYLAKDRFPLAITSDPFKLKRVRDKVRYLQDCIKEKIITIPTDDLHWNSLEYMIYILIRRGYFSKLDELLDDEGLEDWERNKPFLQKLIARISKKWAGSQDPKIIKMREII